MEIIIEILSIPLVQSILKIVFIILLFAMPLGTVLTLMERKWSAMIQDRVGPNRANIGNYTGHGLLHLAADGLKSIFKEDTIPCPLYTYPSPRDRQKHRMPSSA